MYAVLPIQCCQYFIYCGVGFLHRKLERRFYRVLEASSLVAAETRQWVATSQRGSGGERRY